MQIPRKFKLFGETITVEFVDDLALKENLLGQAKYTTNTIRLQKPNEVYVLETIDQTFWHELTHLIFYKLEETELSDNEKVVNNFSNLLHQAIITMEFNNGKSKSNEEV